MLLLVALLIRGGVKRLRRRHRYADDSVFIHSPLKQPLYSGRLGASTSVRKLRPIVVQPRSTYNVVDPYRYEVDAVIDTLRTNAVIDSVRAHAIASPLAVAVVLDGEGDDRPPANRLLAAVVSSDSLAPTSMALLHSSGSTSVV